MTSWDQVDEEHDQVGNDKGPCGGDGDPCDLLGELDPVSVPISSVFATRSRGITTYIHPPSMTAYPSLAATEACAKRPVMKSPIIPARAWTAKISMGSSTRIEALSRVHKFETTAETTPIRAQAGAPQNPAAGVTATSPAMAPVQKPTTDHFRSSRKSINNHVRAPVDPARLVLKTASAALSDPAKQDPPLNPSHPTQRRTVPSTT